MNAHHAANGAPHVHDALALELEHLMHRGSRIRARTDAVLLAARAADRHANAVHLRAEAAHRRAGARLAATRARATQAQAVQTRIAAAALTIVNAAEAPGATAPTRRVPQPGRRQALDTAQRGAERARDDALDHAA